MSNILTDSQLVLLSAASQREDHCLMPPTGARLGPVRKAAAKLLEAGLVKEVRARKEATCGGATKRPPAIEEHSARGRDDPGADRPIGNVARHHEAGGQDEPDAARMGELLLGGRLQQGVSGARRLRGGAVAPVVAI